MDRKAPATVVPVTTGGFVGILLGFVMYELNKRVGVQFDDYEVATLTAIVSMLSGWAAHSFLLRRFAQLLAGEEAPKETKDEAKTATAAGA